MSGMIRRLRGQTDEPELPKLKEIADRVRELLELAQRHARSLDEVESCREELAALAELVAAQRHDVRELSAVIAEVAASKEGFRRTLAEATVATETLKEALRSFDGVKPELQEARVAMEELARQAAQLGRSGSDMREKLEEQRATLEGLETHLGDAEARLREVRGLEALLRERADKANQASSRLEALIDHYKEVDANRDRLSRALIELTDRITKEEARREQLDRSLADTAGHHAASLNRRATLLVVGLTVFALLLVLLQIVLPRLVPG